jgi:hypothetical protein
MAGVLALPTTATTPDRWMPAGRSTGQPPLGHQPTRTAQQQGLPGRTRPPPQPSAADAGPPSSWRLGALLSSEDFGSSVERAAKLHPLWQVRCGRVLQGLSSVHGQRTSGGRNGLGGWGWTVSCRRAAATVGDLAVDAHPRSPWRWGRCSRSLAITFDAAVSMGGPGRVHRGLPASWVSSRPRRPCVARWRAPAAGSRRSGRRRPRPRRGSGWRPSARRCCRRRWPARSSHR